MIHNPSHSPGFYIRIAPDGRSFVDSKGSPWFFLGDTQWELFRMFSPLDARAMLETRKSQGVNVFLVMLNGVPEGGNLGLPGSRPWVDGNVDAIDESYFAHVDSIVDVCAELDAVFIVGVYHKAEADLFTCESAHRYAKFVAARYAEVPNLIWCMYPEGLERYRGVCRAIADGLREGDGGSHLITVHPDPSPASSSFFADEPWIDFNMLQVCVDIDRIHDMVSADFAIQPPVPAIMAEGGYEGIQFGKVQNAHGIRKQAYWSHCSGGYFVYGHNDNYASPTTWRSWIGSDGACDLGVFRRIVIDCSRWWNRVPDQYLIVEGVRDSFELNTACRADDRSWALVYLSSKSAVRINLLGDASDIYRVVWIDPRNGSTVPAGTQTGSETISYESPVDWEDAVLLFSRT